MATSIFYKEVKDETDESITTPVRIDDILMPKALLGNEHDVPKEKEVGIIDSTRDLSNLFELTSENNASAGRITGEKTYIYVGDNPTEKLPLEYEVIGERSQGTRIWSESSNGGYSSRTITLDATKYPSDKAWYMAAMWDSGQGTRDAVCAARFVLPGDSNRSITFDWDFRPRRHYVTYYVKVFEAKPFENQLEKGDLSTIFAAKDANIPWWWHSLKCPHTGFRISVSGTSSGSIAFKDVYNCPYAWYRVQKNNDTYYKDTFLRTKPYKDLVLKGNGGVKGAGTVNFGIMG